MPDYKKMYFALFNAVTDSINSLQEAQQSGEESYIESESQLLPALSVSSIKPEKKKQAPKA